jgi:hypothetical protein
MSGFAQQTDLLASDQMGLGFLASGDDLFDLSHIPVTDQAVGAFGLAPEAWHHTLASDLVALDITGDTPSHQAGFLQLAGLDQATPMFPAAAATPPALPDNQVPDPSGHIHAGLDHGGHALTLDDILAQAADDLAGFHTASGGPAAASHGAMGSGLFTPFAPAEALGGLTELHVLNAA